MDRPHQPGPVRKARVRSGCLTCRSRKVKCDEERPVCFNCTRLNRACFYETTEYHYHRQHRQQQQQQQQQWTHPTQTAPGETQMPLTYDDLFAPGVETGSPKLPFDITAQDAHTSPSGASASFDAMAGEWGDIFSADPYQQLGLQLSPQFGGEDILALPPQPSDVPQRFEYFLNHVQPPFILPWDEANWMHAKVIIANMANHCPQISAAVLAVEMLYETLDNGGETTDCLPSYFTAKAAYALALKNGQLATQPLFVNTFLLACFEVVAQQETVSSTLKQKDSLVDTLEACQDQKPWSTLVQRIIIWLHLFHAKAQHLGGRGILSPKILDLLQDQQNPSLSLRSPALDAGHLGTAPASNPSVKSLQQVLFHFYLDLQRISTLAASMNRHHRPRGAPADESLVDRISDAISRQLDNLWNGRPSILDCTMAELSSLLPSSSQDLLHISLLSRLCKVYFFAETIYYCRSQGRVDTLPQKILPARERIRTLIEEAVVEGSGEAFLHQPALIWPLFLYAVESKSQEEVRWALDRFDAIRNPLWHTDFIKTFLQDLTAEQLRKGERVDSRFYCVEKYGVVPPFL